MFWNTQPPHQRTAAEAGLSEHLLSVAASVSGYLGARLELAGIEGKEALAAYGKVAAFLAAAIVLLFFGYIFLWIGVIALVAYLAGAHWGWVTLCVGILHLLGTLGFLWAAKSRWGKPVFQSTLKEFRKDQEWLSTPQQAARQS